MKLWQKFSLIAISIIFDLAQGFVLFVAATCQIPDIFPPAAIIGAICAASFLGISGIAVIIAAIWSAITFVLTRRRVAVGAGVIEAIPILNILPVYTASSLYLIIKNRR